MFIRRITIYVENAAAVVVVFVWRVFGALSTVPVVVAVAKRIKEKQKKIVEK